MHWEFFVAASEFWVSVIALKIAFCNHWGYRPRSCKSVYDDESVGNRAVGWGGKKNPKQNSEKNLT